jgi:transposase
MGVPTANAIATRYDKTARYFLGAIHLAAAIIWLN